MTLWPRLVFLAPLLLGGCETIGSIFVKDEAPPLEGQRVSILAGETSITVSSALEAVAVRLPAPYVNGGWTQAGGSPSHAMYHLALPDLPLVAWDADIGEGSGSDAAILAEPVAVGDAVFTLDSRSIVTAYQAQTGGVFWRIDLSPEEEDDGYFGGGLAYDGGRLFVTTGFGTAFALDARTGAVAWQQSLPGPVRAAPAAADGRIFVVTLANQGLALAQSDGRILWTHEGIEEPATILGSASPAVQGTTVLMPYSSGEIFALSVESGNAIWSDNLSASRRTEPLSDLAQIRGEPVIDRGFVYVTSHADRLAAFDLKRGGRIWEKDFGGTQRPWAAGDWLYVITNDQEVVCLSRESGEVKWVTAMPQFADPEDKTEPLTWYGPVLASDRLLVAGSNGDAYALSPYTGERLGAIDLPSGAAVAPIVANNVLFFVSDDADLVSLR